MPTILGANSVSDTGYDVANSLRFDDDSSHSLTRTFGSGNQKTWTWSAWVKKTANLKTLGDFDFVLFNGYQDSNNRLSIFFGQTSGGTSIVDDCIAIFGTAGGSTSFNVSTSAVFRDNSAWMHIVVALDTTQSTASNRVKIYVNGVQQTLNFDTTPAEDSDQSINFNQNHTIGNYNTNTASTEFDGYMAEVVFIDGSALDPTSFGEFDEDSPTIWKPKDVSGLTFGTNGFYLDFENASSLGADVSGNSNNFTVNNLTSIDQTTDTCTNNFITLNPLVLETNRTDNQIYSEGNTIVIPNSHDNYATASSTIGLKGAGKWYWEAQIVWNGTASNAYYPRTIGFVTHDYAYSASYLDQDEESWAIIYQAGGGPGWRIGHANSESNISGATAMADGDTMIFALDLDNGKFYAGRNGTFYTSGDPTSGATGTGALATLDATDLSKFLFPAVTNASNATYYKFNFGNPAYSISSGNSDENGFGNFEYSVPSGYLAICSKNLAENG